MNLEKLGGLRLSYQISGWGQCDAEGKEQAGKKEGREKGSVGSFRGGLYPRKLDVRLKKGNDNK